LGNLKERTAFGHRFVDGGYSKGYFEGI